jgi:hypothetical protein
VARASNDDVYDLVMRAASSNVTVEAIAGELGRLAGG